LNVFSNEFLVDSKPIFITMLHVLF